MVMPRPFRWIVGLLLAGALLVGVLLLPFADWLPGGTVADLPLQQVVNGSNFNRLFPPRIPTSGSRCRRRSGGSVRRV